MTGYWGTEFRDSNKPTTIQLPEDTWTEEHQEWTRQEFTSSDSQPFLRRGRERTTGAEDDRPKEVVMTVHNSFHSHPREPTLYP